MAWPPTVADFKAQFRREFRYDKGGDSVTDDDISRAIGEASASISQSLYPTATAANYAYLYLAAHILILNVQGAGGLSARPLNRGVRNVGEGVQVAKGVGQTNVTYQVPPPRVAANPLMLWLFRTDFGQRYMAMTEPLTAACAVVVCGPTPDQFNQE